MVVVNKSNSVYPAKENDTLSRNRKTKKLSDKASDVLHAIESAQTAQVIMAGTSNEDIDGIHPRIVLSKISRGKTCRECEDDETVYSQGDPADAVFYIEQGRVRLAVVSSSAKEAIVAILPEGSFFGEGSLAGQPLRVGTASAVERSKIIRVSKRSMVQLLHEEPEFTGRFLAHMLARNIRMEADLVDHLFNSSEKRLARLLLLMANFGQESKPIPLITNMSQENLAEMIGTTCSRVSFFMNRFRKLGFIEYNDGGMNVHSSLVSVVLHE
jgi:CRP-like cAMP-binding protein